MYPSLAIANFFIKKSLEESIPLTSPKVIKLTYIAHGYVMAMEQKVLVSDVVEAWEYGPMFSRLFHALKRFGNDKITHLCSMVDGERMFIPEVNGSVALDILERVWDSYKDYTVLQLGSMTNAEGTPWAETMKLGINAIVIPNDLIKRYYKNLLKGTDEE